MRKDLFNRYIWIVDTIQRYGKITRRELNELWLKSVDGDGEPIPARTFFHYRRAIEENFQIDIECNKAGEYYIDSKGTRQDQQFRNWLMDSYAMRGVLSDSSTMSDRILVEDVPSARRFMSSVMEAMKQSKKIVFTYQSYNRSLPDVGIVFHPYFVKLFKQRWYVIGYKEKDKSIKTYALDRITEMTISDESFQMPESVDPSTFFDDYFGITTSFGEVKRISLQVNYKQAKYFRALPLHQSQIEELHDSYSIFSYHMKLTGDLVRELLSYGDSVKVLQPMELVAMIKDELQRSLKQYQ